ncbi:MAG: Arc/MetJ family transcription regulator [Ascidiaceihabitans sp.]|jgi:Arc/MetJ family transcription regulator
MTHPILQTTVPDEMGRARALPGVAPCAPRDWLRIDDAYAAQMARRLDLINTQRDAVVWMDNAALPAAIELLDATLDLLPDLGFVVDGDHVTCPDGRKVAMSRTDPLGSLGAVVQEDLCLLEKRGDEHVLIGAVLCFPASWLLAEKVGRPLSAIHDPVDEYDAGLAARVQRLFDGVQIGRPLWRMNQLWYVDPELHQPRSQTTPRAILDGPNGARYYRSERQCILRLPVTQAVVFTIHTFVLNAADVDLG